MTDEEAVCTWVHTTQPDDDDEYLDTDCGHVVFFDAGDPIENSYRFCPFCGRPLRYNHEED